MADSSVGREALVDDWPFQQVSVGKRGSLGILKPSIRPDKPCHIVCCYHTLRINAILRGGLKVNDLGYAL